MPQARIFINKDEVPIDQFPLKIRDVMHGNQSKMIFFQGSPENDYETTMRFLDMARMNGAKNIGIIVEAAQ
jgi:biopolymer transport protein ExbD